MSTAVRIQARVWWVSMLILWTSAVLLLNVFTQQHVFTIASLVMLALAVYVAVTDPVDAEQ